MRSQPRGQQGRSRTILAAAGGVIALLLLLSACSGGEEDAGPSLSESRVSAGGVTLSLPEGWTFLDNDGHGLVLAEREGDLTAVVPKGPRLTVAPASTEPPAPEALVNAIAGAGGEAAATGFEIVEQPETVRVGSEQGVSVELREGGGESAVIRRYVIVNADGITVYQFVLEAPEGEWDNSVGTLEVILGSAAFDPPGRD